jgi:pimeloyl-ACP methyl ester carboxylesterase
MTIFPVLLAMVGAVAAAAAAVALYLALVTRRIARNARRLVPPPGKFITVDGNRIHYVERGQGRPILFVHGLGGTQFHFLPLLAGLEKDFRLIAVDRPGSGYSTRRGLTPASPEEQAAFIAKFIDALGLEKPLLVGHSLGGAIALATALDHGDKISGLALISPLTHVVVGPLAEFNELDIASPFRRWMIAHTIGLPRSIKLAPQTLDFVFGPQKPPADYAIAGGAMSVLQPSHFFTSSTDFRASGEGMRERQERYGELAMPVGMIYGTADRVLDWEAQGKAMTGKVAGLDFETLDGVGHMPQYAETDRVEAFIRRIAARAFAGG